MHISHAHMLRHFKHFLNVRMREHRKTYFLEIWTLFSESRTQFSEWSQLLRLLIVCRSTGRCDVLCRWLSSEFLDCRWAAGSFVDWMADSLTCQTVQDKDRNDKLISPIHCGVELFIQINRIPAIDFKIYTALKCLLLCNIPFLTLIHICNHY